MTKKNEIVVVEMPTEARLRISNQIVVRMQKLGYTPFNFEALHLGFELAPGWPIDVHAQPTMAELVVVAGKLGMCIVIGDINLVPLQQDATSQESGGVVAGDDGS